MALKRDLHFYRFMGIGTVVLIATFGSRVLANAPLPPQAPVGTSAIPQDVSEIRVKRRDDLGVDQEMKRLSQTQGQYRERMAVPRSSSAQARTIKKARVKSVRR